MHTTLLPHLLAIFEYEVCVCLSVGVCIEGGGGGGRGTTIMSQIRMIMHMYIPSTTLFYSGKSIYLCLFYFERRGEKSTESLSSIWQE